MMNRKIVQTSFFGSKVVLDYQSKAEIWLFVEIEYTNVFAASKPYTGTPL